MVVASEPLAQEGILGGKLQHWRASQAENAPKAAPVLEFALFTLCGSGPLSIVTL